ncbi:DUF6207 family protein [Streptomyces sp. NPDC059861]|uniref:DUF6207 family protein n=1 Tax=Streptomyces sp. NPDC059861 TaxID=3346974 RepID=UPI003648B829
MLFTVPDRQTVPRPVAHRCLVAVLLSRYAVKATIRDPLAEVITSRVEHARHAPRLAGCGAIQNEAHVARPGLIVVDVAASDDQTAHGVSDARQPLDRSAEATLPCLDGT